MRKLGESRLPMRESEQRLRLLMAEAPTLVAEGRTQELQARLREIPVSKAMDAPWALYWSGVCHLASSPSQAREYFERAFALFEGQGAVSPLFLAWAGVVESLVLEAKDFTSINQWLARFRGLVEKRGSLSKLAETASVFAYVSGLLHAEPDHPDLPIYAAQAERLLGQDIDINQRMVRATTLVLYYAWRGEGVRIKGLLEELVPGVSSPDIRPFAQLHWYLCNVIYTGASEDSLRTLNDALALADLSGIHSLSFRLYTHCIWAQLCSGNVSVARDLLQRMGTSTGMGRVADAFYHHCASIVSLHDGNAVSAVEAGHRAVEMAKQSGTFLGVVVFLVALGHAHASRGDLDAAAQTVAKARAMATGVQSKLVALFCLFAEATVLNLRGESEGALRALREALALARETGVVMPPAWCPRDHAVALFDTALEAGICTDYVQSMIVRTRLPPAQRLPQENWPWKIRLYTLGRFDVVRDGESLAFSGRTQKKPLELLRTLVAFGGRGAPVARLAQTMWPGAEAGVANHALETTLYRLRKLLGDRCIQVHSGQLSLDPDHCWVDLWNLERLLEPDGPVASPVAPMRRLFAVYRGPFLDGDETPAVVIQREQLHSKFLRAVGQLGRELELRAEHDAAIECYQRGIEADPLAEDLYRRLMRCYHNLRRPAEALAVYQRCYKTLTSVLGIEPTLETVALYREIQDGDLRRAYAEGW